MARKLYIRPTSTSPWYGNLSRGGIQVYKDGQWHTLLPTNTKVYSKDAKGFVCIK